MRIIVLVVAVVYLATAVFMWVAPQFWYDATPGVSMMGSFNSHFIRDVAIAFLISAGAIAFGLINSEKNVSYFGFAWPCLHAVFHIWIWLTRGVPLDTIAITNLLGIQLPAWLGLFCAIGFFRGKGQS